MTMWSAIIKQCDPMSSASPVYSTHTVSTRAPSIINRIAVLNHHVATRDGGGSDRSGEMPRP